MELLENSTKISEQSKQKFNSQLNSAMDISRNVRNLVAHNHVLMELYQNKDDGSFYESEYIISSRNRNKKLPLSNLASFAKEAERLAEETSETYLTIVGEYFER